MVDHKLRKKITAADLKLHTLDILEGCLFNGKRARRSFIQEYVGRDPIFRRWAYRGTPDIRIIVFNKSSCNGYASFTNKKSLEDVPICIRVQLG